MIEKQFKNVDEAINDLARQVDGYSIMMATRGWNDLKAEIDFHVASLQEMLTTCDLDKVRDLQGQIASFRWLMGHFAEVAENLERLQNSLKAETTE